MRTTKRRMTHRATDVVASGTQPPAYANLAHASPNVTPSWLTATKASRWREYPASAEYLTGSAHLISVDETNVASTSASVYLKGGRGGG